MTYNPLSHYARIVLAQSDYVDECKAVGERPSVAVISAYEALLSSIHLTINYRVHIEMSEPRESEYAS